jgi:hypothetical protein
MQLTIIEEQTFLTDLTQSLICQYAPLKLSFCAKQKFNADINNSPWLNCKLNKMFFAIQALDQNQNIISNALLTLFISSNSRSEIVFENEVNTLSETTTIYSFRIENSKSQIQAFRIGINTKEQRLLNRLASLNQSLKLLNQPKFTLPHSITIKLQIADTKIFEQIRSQTKINIELKNLKLIISKNCFQLLSLTHDSKFLLITKGESMENQNLQLGIDLLNIEISASDFNNLRTGTKLQLDCPKQTKAFLKIDELRFAEVNIEFTENRITMQIEKEYCLPLSQVNEETISVNWR